MDSFTYLVIPDHRRVLLRQRLAVLQLVNTLSSVAFLELVSDYTSLHSLNPRFPNVFFAGLDTL